MKQAPSLEEASALVPENESDAAQELRLSASPPSWACLPWWRVWEDWSQPFVDAGILRAVPRHRATALWLGLAVLLALAIAVTFTVLLFYPISRAAGLLMLPYAAWLVFAGTLNLWAALHN